MSIRPFLIVLLLSPILEVLAGAQAQSFNSVLATPGAVDQPNEAPKLEHFDPGIIDQGSDPCDDFYKYACRKWLAANPVPPDQVF